MLNKDNTVTISNIKFDIPDKEHINRTWNSNVVKDGKTTTRNIWIDSYINIKDNSTVSIESHKISMTNRGKVMFDDKDVRNKEDSDNIKLIFENIKEQ